MKRAVKYTLMISGIISLCISCLFSYPVYARTTTNDLRIWAIQQSYTVYQQIELEYQNTRSVVQFTNLHEYLDNYDNYGSNYIDYSVPTFICCYTSLIQDVYDLPTSVRCFTADNLSQFNVTDTSGNNLLVNFVDTMFGITIPNNPYSLSYIDISILRSLGYEITSFAPVTYNSGGSSGYMYVLNKLTGQDYGTFTGNIDVTNTNIDVTRYIQRKFLRVSYNPNIIRDQNSNIVECNFDYEYIVINDVYPRPNTWLYNWDAYYIYETNDLIFYNQHNVYDTDNNLIGTTFDIAITGPNPYYILLYRNQTATPDQQYDGWTHLVQSCKKISKDVASNDLTQTNAYLLEIIDLLSDLQVTEINNIYQDITNEYNVDIDLTLNNVIDDISLHIQDFDFTDEDYQIPETDLQKISGFRLIFTNMIQTMNSNGIGILWFLPLVLLVLGALL